MNYRFSKFSIGAVELVFDELRKAEEKYPGWPDDLIHAVAIITEEVGEAMQDAIDLTYWKYNPVQGFGTAWGSEEEYRASRLNDLRIELAQVGAMAIRALINLEKKQA